MSGSNSTEHTMERRAGDKILIGPDIIVKIKVISINGKVLVCVTAPDSMSVSYDNHKITEPHGQDL